MQPRPSILFAVSECTPYAKTGGLGDVAQALPAALRRLGADVRILLPGYAGVMEAIERADRTTVLPGTHAHPESRLIEATLAGDVPAFVLDLPAYYRRMGGPYQDPTGQDWSDNALRFGLLCETAARIASDTSPLAWRCDVLHCHDWQTGLAPALSRWRAGRHAPTVITVHNLAYQGLFPMQAAAELDLPPEAWSIDGAEFYGNLSFLKAGIRHADRITTVSPNYAREIQSEELGFGLQGLLAGRREVLTGILNGIDAVAWDPGSDPFLASNFGPETLPRKHANREALDAHTGLAPRPDVPLLAVVSRLVHQKGLDLLASIVERVLALPAQIVVMGTGDATLEDGFRALAARHPGDFAFVNTFDEPLSHLVEAGADIFVMPSRFEPCGLNQMYSQRYGTPPVVRRTGGLADSVIDCSGPTLADATASGFVFDDATPDALYAALERAVRTWHEPATWHRLQRNGMARDFSWTHSAEAYLRVYEGALKGR